MGHRRATFVLLAIALFAAACDEKLGVGTAPSIQVLPSPSYSFASVPIGSRDSVTFTVTNRGGGTLTVSSIELAPNSSGDFTIPVAPNLPRDLGKNQSFEFDVEYRPSDVTSDTGRLVVRSSDAQKPAVNVDLLTQQIGPDITVEPSTLDFGVVERGQTQTLTARIRNEGLADLVVENISLSPGSDFHIVQPANLPLTLAPGGSTELRVSYAPTGCSADEEAIPIFSNDIDESPFLVTARGRPPGPAIAATPSPVSFGAVNLGQSSTQTVTLKNVGTTDLHISSVVLGIGTNAGFTIQAPQTPLTLTQGQTADVPVTFRAQAAGLATGSLVAASDDCDHPQLQVPLDAIGTDGPAPLIQVTPATVNFGNVAARSTGERTFNVVSIGQMPLQVSGIALEAGTTSEFQVVQTGGFTLAACSTPPCPSQTITVRYTPSATGGDSGRAVVSSNAANDPNAKVALLGNGTEGATCALRVTPGTLQFGRVLLGTHKDLPITLTNEGTGNCNYDKTEIPFGFLQGFSVQSQPGIGAAIPPGTQKQVVVRYRPPALGVHFTIGSVSWTDPTGTGGGSAAVVLAGESTESDIEIVPARLDLGTITLGCASQVTTVTVFNTGAADLTITAVRLQTSPSPFQIIQAPAPGTVVPGGGSVQIRVRYVPTQVGTDTNTLVIESTDTDEPTRTVPLTGRGTTTVDVIDKFLQSTEPKVDILVVVDNSGSMSEEQQNLRTNFRSFAQFAQSLNVSYQIGVVTTDNPKLRGNPKIIKSTDADPVGEFDRNANVGTSGSGTEQGLEMAYRALSEPLVNTDNAGLLRDDASLEIIIVSDEEDQSPQNLDFYVTFFFSIKGPRNTSLFRLSAIAGDVPSGCDSGAGSAEAGRRYQEVANRTAGVFGSICDSNFSQTLQAIGNRAFGLRVQFFLSRQPDMSQPFTVRRYASEAACDADPNATGGTGVPQDPNNGFTFDAPSNSIIFGPAAVPPRGSCIKAKYRAACIPP